MNGPDTRALLSGVVVHGDARGRTLGFPTANLALTSGRMPRDGVYAALVRIDAEPERHRATVSVGDNPTFPGERERRVEVHLHALRRDLYERTLEVELVAYLRGVVEFDAAGDLAEQVERDVRRSDALLRESQAAAPAAGRVRTP